MAPRTSKKPKRTPKKKISIFLELSWRNNERIHIRPHVDATTTSLTSLIYLASDELGSDSPVLTVLQALLFLSPYSTRANFVYMGTEIPITLWETTTLQGIGVKNYIGTAVLTLDVDMASLYFSPVPKSLPASTDRETVCSRVDMWLKNLEAKSAKLGILALSPGQQLMQRETGSDDTVEGGGGGETDGALDAVSMKKLDEIRKKRAIRKWTVFVTALICDYTFNSYNYDSFKIAGDFKKHKHSTVYKYAQLRICFPDGHSLSCRFHPTETIESVKDFVRDAMSSHSLPEFDLYVSSPGEVLQDSSTILNEGLVPAARVHVSWKGSSGPIAGSSFIRPELFFTNHDEVNIPAFQRLMVDTARNNLKSAEGSSNQT